MPTPTPIKPPETLHDQMVHLLTGNLRGLSALRLRRRIAREPELSQEWDGLQAVTSRLQQSHMPTPQRPAPQWGGARALDLPDSVLRKRAGKRRHAAAVAVVVPALAVGAAFYTWSFSNVTFRDSRERTWVVHSTFPGEVRLYDMNGVKIGSFRTAPLFSYFSAPGGVRTRMDDEPLKFVYGEGTHPLRDSRGGILGYAALVPDTPLDESERQHDVVQLERDNTFALGEVMDSGTSWSTLNSAGYVDRKTGLAWKLQGRSVVTFGYGNAPPRPPQQQTPQYPQQNLVPTILNQLPKTPWEVEQEMRRETMWRQFKPLLRWSIADPRLGKSLKRDGDYLLYRGRWVHPWRFGDIRTYGKHIIRDDDGNPLVTFDIQPLPPVAAPDRGR